MRLFMRDMIAGELFQYRSLQAKSQVGTTKEE